MKLLKQAYLISYTFQAIIYWFRVNVGACNTNNLVLQRQSSPLGARVSGF